MAWLRIATAALVFAPWTRPWRIFARADRAARLLLLAFGACLAVMNCSFYLALDRLPIALVAAIEFVGTIGVALVGLRSPRNLARPCRGGHRHLAFDRRQMVDDPVGLFWAFLNGALFVCYIMLGHRIAASGAGGGIGALGAAMAIAFLLVLPIGFADALPAFSSTAAAARRHRRRRLLVGHPLHLRPARHVAAAARELRADAVAAAGHGDTDRRHRASPDPQPHRLPRHHSGGRRRRLAQTGAKVIHREARAIPGKCVAVFRPELRQNKELYASFSFRKATVRPQARSAAFLS